MRDDDPERFVYRGAGRVPWWQTGVPVPVDRPRDFVWPMVAYDDPGTVLVLTMDLRTLKLYAHFERLTEATARRMMELRGRG